MQQNTSKVRDILYIYSVNSDKLLVFLQLMQNGHAFVLMFHNNAFGDAGYNLQAAKH